MKKTNFLFGITSAITLLFSVGTSHALLPSQSQDFSTDPLWVASGNTTLPQNYGYRNSNHITGATEGEAGGTIGTSTSVGYYADISVDTVFLTTNLIASGKLTMDAFNGINGSWNLGWFNRNETSTPNFFGFNFAEPLSGSGPFRVRLMLVRPGGDERASAFVTIDTGKDYDFTFSYDPLGASGLGAITATLTGLDGGADKSLSMNLGGGDRFGPSRFNAFGILTPNQGFGGASTADFFVDNLQYSIPEPTTVALAGLATVLLLRRRFAR